MESIITAIEIYPDRVRLLDQRKLPLVEEYVECRTYQEVAEAIRTMVVRGAPAIGVAAAGGIALGVQHVQSDSAEDRAAQFETICTTLARTRPTAVNLFWAIDRMRPRARQYQGARLTTWELQRDHIPVTLITDNMAGYFMHAGQIDLVIVGADRIAANGDAANKIGTYSLAVLAKEHHIPFYVAAPLSTIDLATATGADIPIEQRHGDEVRLVGTQRIASPDVEVANPAFDVTPARYIRGIITEVGVAMPPNEETIAALFISK